MAIEDKIYLFLKNYNKLPFSVQKAIGKCYNFIPNSVRYGKFYNDYQTRIHYFNNSTTACEVKSKQLKLLFDIVNYAGINIPFYYEFPICNSIEDFKKLPIITKQELIQNKQLFINKKLSNYFLKVNTGGSTGAPLEFFIQKGVTRSKEAAHFEWYWKLFGYKTGSKMFAVRGSPLRNNALYQYQSIKNILNVSCYNIHKNNINIIINEINSFNPKFIWAYPSALKNLLSTIEETKSNLNINIRSIFVGSEYLSLLDKDKFSKYFNAKVVNWYGHSEYLIHGGYCNKNDLYHFYPFYGYIELLDDNGLEITEPGRTGKIVATGFDNKVMPFIRYDTGDFGTLSKYNKCVCGFKGTMLECIDGRQVDLIVLSDHTKVSLTAFIFGQHFAEFGKIIEFQIHQNKIGIIKIKLVTLKEFNNDDEKKLLTKMLSSVDNKLKISFEYVNQIEKTHRGKHRFFVNNIKKLS